MSLEAHARILTGQTIDPKVAALVTLWETPLYITDEEAQRVCTLGSPTRRELVLEGFTVQQIEQMEFVRYLYRRELLES